MSIKDELEWNLKLLPMPDPHKVRAVFEVSHEMECSMRSDDYLVRLQRAELANQIAHFIADDPSFYVVRRRGGDRWSPAHYSMDCVVMSPEMYENLCISIKNTVFSHLYDEIFKRLKDNFSAKLRKIRIKFADIVAKLEAEIEP